MDKSLRIGVIDADQDVRFGRKLILESEPNFEIVFESDGRREDLEQIAEGLIDVLVLDQKVSLGPASSFYRELAQVTGVKQAPNCIMTCSFEQPGLTLDALEVGVLEVVTLEKGAKELIEAVTRANSGNSSIAIADLYELVKGSNLTMELDMNLIQLVNSLPERLASNLRRLRQVWKKGSRGNLGGFDEASMANLVDRLQAKTLAQLIIKLHRSELLGE